MFCLIILFIFCFLSVNPALALTNPFPLTTSVTATVPGFPSTPTLISPANNAVLNTTVPSFIFNPSDNTVTITHYQLVIDGSKNTDHIPNIGNTISTNALTALSEGQHTWKIIAISSHGNQTASATWSFTIDITAPLILVNQVAEHQVSLSSLDLTTIPAGYQLTTTQQTPQFSGQSEANAIVAISLSNSGINYTLTTTAVSNATFTVKPDSKLSLGSYTVFISSTDTAGNATNLPSFTLIVKSAAIPSITISLPSPLPSITIPGLPLIPQLTLPPLPAALKAFPIAPESPTAIYYLPWLVILLLFIHLCLILRRAEKKSEEIRKTHFVFFLPLGLVTILLIYLALSFPHWITIGLGIIGLFVFNWQISIKNHPQPKQSEDINKHQS